MPETMPETMTIRRWLIAGRVQGVGFRWFVCRQAERLGVEGWVRNLEGGRVEAVARGLPRVLDELAARLAQGPTASRVEIVTPATAPLEVPARGFASRANGPPGGLDDESGKPG